MVKKLNSLFELDKAGSITRVRGVKVIDESSSQLIRVFAERSKSAPPKKTDWALRGAYSFAKGLQTPSGKEDLGG